MPVQPRSRGRPFVDVLGRSALDSDTPAPQSTSVNRPYPPIPSEFEYPAPPPEQALRLREQLEPASSTAVTPLFSHPSECL